MTEEDAWQDLERRATAQQTQAYLQMAHTEAAKFIAEHKSELGIMTLRRAFEIGFRTGFTNGANTRTK